MRTTLSLDDSLATQLKAIAVETGKPFKQIVNEMLSIGLQYRQQPRAKPYHLTPAKMGAPCPGVNLDKALYLADALEDEAIVAKLEQRK
ncbi:MAG: DUF2191 domain-containing protein [Gammaproteobacteria bacterium]|nr:DUF2191 domain-containing protein [Gammaproteobacteria bacterium]